MKKTMSQLAWAVVAKANTGWLVDPWGVNNLWQLPIFANYTDANLYRKENKYRAKGYKLVKVKITLTE